MKSGNFTKLNTSLVTNMASMFNGSGSEVETYELIGLDNWDVSRVTDMGSMFFKGRSKCN